MLISWERALDIIKNNTKVLSEEKIDIEEALGRIVSKDIYSNVIQSAFQNSAMDGIGITKQQLEGDYPLELKLRRRNFAGDNILEEVQDLADNECVHIMTGGYVPENIVAIIPIENVLLKGEKVIIKERVKYFTNIRSKGEDFCKGDLLISKGTYLKLQHINLLAVAGVKELQVYRKLKIAIFTTGKELVKIGEKLDLGKVYDSNLLLMKNFLKDIPCEIITLKTTKDDILILKHNIVEAINENVDAIISNGAISKGEKDIVRDYLEKKNILYQGVSLRPGKPSTLAKINNTLFFATAGNPMSCITSLRFLFYYFIRYSNDLGVESSNKAILEEDFQDKKSTRFAFKGKTFIKEGCLKVKALDRQLSHLVSSFSRANCFILSEKNKEDYKKGELVDIYPISIWEDIL